MGMYLMPRWTTKDPSHFPENSMGLFLTPFFFARSSISTFYVLLVLFMKFAAWPGCLISFSFNT